MTDFVNAAAAPPTVLKDNTFGFCGVQTDIRVLIKLRAYSPWWELWFHGNTPKLSNTQSSERNNITGVSQPLSKSKYHRE